MDSDQLKDILNNEDKFDQFIKDLPQLKALQEEKEMLLTSNKSLAEYNLSQEPQVREGRARLQEKYNSAKQLGEEVRALKASLDSKQGSTSPEVLLALLETAHQQVEEESEVMTDSFLGGEGVLEEFLERYHEKRKLAHLRRVKVDKLKETLAGGGRQQNTPSRSAPPPPTGRPGGTGGAGGAGGAPGYSWGAPQLPYPATPQYNMPMPPNYR